MLTGRIRTLSFGKSDRLRIRRATRIEPGTISATNPVYWSFQFTMVIINLFRFKQKFEQLIDNE